MYNFRINVNHLLTIQIVALLCCWWFNSTPSQAAPPTNGDYFGRVTNQPSNAVNKSPFSVSIDPAVSWFEAFDKLIFTYSPTAADRVILSRPFNQESERVQQWSRTASKVAKNYRQLSKCLKILPTPNNLKGFKEYRNLVADWYDDAAMVFEDLTCPRPAAHTIEELQSQLNEVNERSASLGQANTNLKSMDLSLRQAHKVPLQDDAIQKFVHNP